jgi:hypothetical protein
MGDAGTLCGGRTGESADDCESYSRDSEHINPWRPNASRRSEGRTAKVFYKLLILKNSNWCRCRVSTGYVTSSTSTDQYSMAPWTLLHDLP